jgi:hypothetical protein
MSGLSLGAGTASSYMVPAAAIMPANGSYMLNFSISSGSFMFFAQDANGSLLASGTASYSGVTQTTTITLSDGTVVTSATVLPLSPSSPTYLTVYDPDPVNPVTWGIVFNTSMG